MFSDNALYIKALNNFANAAGIIVGSKVMSLESFLEFVPHSDIIAATIQGELFYANTSAFTLSTLLCQEAMGNKYDDESYLRLLESYTSRNIDLIAYWCLKIELDIGMKKNKDISELREKVSSSKLLDLFHVYHVFLNTDVIIKEQYGE